MLKNCRSKASMRSIVDNGGVASVTLMLHSTHVRMLNEAVVALTVLTATLCNDVSDDSDADATLIHRHLHIDLVINGIKRCFCEEALNVPPEVKVRLKNLCCPQFSWLPSWLNWLLNNLADTGLTYQRYLCLMPYICMNPLKIYPIEYLR